MAAVEKFEYGGFGDEYGWGYGWSFIIED